MSQERRDLAVMGLRWTVGVVILLESLNFTLSHSTARHLAAMGLPQWFHPVLGGGEIVAALLFLIPATAAAGGALLLFIFAAAIAVHLLHGEFDVGNLVIYATAVIVCMTPAQRMAARRTENDR